MLCWRASHSCRKDVKVEDYPIALLSHIRNTRAHTSSSSPVISSISVSLCLSLSSSLSLGESLISSASSDSLPLSESSSSSSFEAVADSWRRNHVRTVSDHNRHLIKHIESSDWLLTFPATLPLACLTLSSFTCGWVTGFFLVSFFFLDLVAFLAPLFLFCQTFDLFLASPC